MGKEKAKDMIFMKGMKEIYRNNTRNAFRF